MDSLNRHVTVRDFSKKRVSTDLLNSIIYSGTRASTTGNMQLYSVVVTQNRTRIEQMSSLHFNQPVARSAPVYLTFIADFNRFIKWCDINKASHGYNNFLSFFTASIDAILVAQNVCIAAEHSGLGICYLGTTVYNAEEIINFLKLPKYTFPVTTVALGYPEAAPNLSDRIPLEGIIHNEYYYDYNEEAIKNLYHLKEELETSKKFVSENNKDNLAQVFTDVRYKKADNEYFSEKMLKTIRKQGFEF
ncbi:MAG: NADPH-dependent oxidoreductase [Draconibacterium sp.]|nr:MAG: NADPH-dependent oxidoreductase [Draconibacterium sp.]